MSLIGGLRELIAFRLDVRCRMTLLHSNQPSAKYKNRSQTDSSLAKPHASQFRTSIQPLDTMGNTLLAQINGPLRATQATKTRSSPSGPKSSPT